MTLFPATLQMFAVIFRKAMQQQHARHPSKGAIISKCVDIK